MLMLAAGLVALLAVAIVVATRGPAAPSDRTQPQTAPADAGLGAEDFRNLPVSKEGPTEDKPRFVPSRPFTRIPSH